MEANSVLLQKKYARIVALFAEQMQLTLNDALEFFYRSETYQELCNGIADLHCLFCASALPGGGEVQGNPGLSLWEDPVFVVYASCERQCRL